MHFVWHTFWHFFWHICRRSFWHIFWRSFWHTFWHFSGLSSDMLTFLPTFFLPYLLTFFLTYLLLSLLTYLLPNHIVTSYVSYLPTSGKRQEMTSHMKTSKDSKTVNKADSILTASQSLTNHSSWNAPEQYNFADVSHWICTNLLDQNIDTSRSTSGIVSWQRSADVPRGEPRRNGNFLIQAPIHARDPCAWGFAPPCLGSLTCCWSQGGSCWRPSSALLVFVSIPMPTLARFYPIQTVPWLTSGHRLVPPFAGVGGIVR